MAEFLSGKASVMWLFIMSENISEEELLTVQDIYEGYQEKEYEIPVCRGYEEAEVFLAMNNCFFKVVADFDSCEELLKHELKNVVDIYIYNPSKERGMARMYEFKRANKKVRGMFMSLTEAKDVAAKEVENEVKLVRVGDELEKDRERLRFPSFFILAGEDNSDVTNYRLCLYGALKLR